MPVYLHEYIQPQGEIGLWEILETEAMLQNVLRLTEEETILLQDVIPKRRQEWMAGRLLLHRMSGRNIRAIAQKDAYGKPHLPDSPYDISLSHSGKFAAVIATPFACGIDIQEIVAKLERIQHKFMTTEDLEWLSKENFREHLHVCWGAKEAMYKAYGKKKLEFREHILLEPFTFDVTIGACRGYVVKEDIRMSFDIYYQQIENYILVYAIQTEE